MGLRSIGYASVSPFNPWSTVVNNEALILDLLESISRGARPYRDVMDAWRTSCPRLPIWEDAVEGGLVSVQHQADGETVVAITTAGIALLNTRRPRA